MNKLLKIAVLLLIVFQTAAQNIPLLDASNRWILVNNKIERNEIYLTSYKKSKVRLNTLVLSFAENGKIVYDYETNSKTDGNPNIKYLDINTAESSWTFDTLSKTLSLVIQAGYTTFDDFKFKREYKIDEVTDGFILMKTNEVFFEDLKRKSVTMSQPVRKPTPVKPIITEKKSVVIAKVPLVDSTKVVQNNVEVSRRDSMVVNVTVTKKELIEEVKTQPVVIAPPVKINYLEQFKTLFDKSSRWILVRNKIERGDIYLTPYHESKLTINNLVLSLANEGKIEYDYESDPKVKFCAGVDFLDIDTDETSWEFDSENNIFTLTIKGGYASLDDFKFKRDYTVEAFDDGFALRRVKEHYFNDFRKPVKAAGNYQRRRK
ncbi:hypothetical protein GCM10011514_21230 [Emticicia aquatilis]|uniref:DUF4412 domain-containing protein n=1 Tax=Emticicia aquatilis TaxID=1537369 RepID=A0A917DQH3_9BACT|nr:hypothetical protein [Emticicia aquatilis]GGD56878.1 hypothetical protein GCM10011514_21230 [Emticicia aquatilis]